MLLIAEKVDQEQVSFACGLALGRCQAHSENPLNGDHIEH
jgi:hypothetical protein